MVLVAGGEHAEQMDSVGESALGLLRSLGLPSMMAVAQGHTANLGLQERSAIKKRARTLVSAQVGLRVPDVKLVCESMDTIVDNQVVWCYCGRVLYGKIQLCRSLGARTE